VHAHTHIQPYTLVAHKIVLFLMKDKNAFYWLLTGNNRVPVPRENVLCSAPWGPPKCHNPIFSTRRNTNSWLTSHFVELELLTQVLTNKVSHYDAFLRSRISVMHAF
jgi:hypothetical protein